MSSGYLPKRPDMHALSDWLHVNRGEHQHQGLHSQGIHSLIELALGFFLSRSGLALAVAAWPPPSDRRHLHGGRLCGGEDLGRTPNRALEPCSAAHPAQAHPASRGSLLLQGFMWIHTLCLPQPLRLKAGWVCFKRKCGGATRCGCAFDSNSTDQRCESAPAHARSCQPRMDSKGAHVTDNINCSRGSLRLQMRTWTPTYPTCNTEYIFPPLELVAFVAVAKLPCSGAPFWVL